MCYGEAFLRSEILLNWKTSGLRPIFNQTLLQKGEAEIILQYGRGMLPLLRGRELRGKSFPERM